MSATAHVYSLVKHNRDGALTTQRQRKNMLLQAVDQLGELGFKIQSLHGLKPKHIYALVDHWHEEGINPRSMANRMCGIRWALEKCGKHGMIAKLNAELGIVTERDLTIDRAYKITQEMLEQFPSKRMRLSVRLMAEFGLRRKEALMFTPSVADKGDFIALHAKWCKGGRSRVIEVETASQRALLDEARALVGNTSMIGDDAVKYSQANDSLGYCGLKKAGLSSFHGLRHNWAQEKYERLTGWACPKRGGIARADMTAEQQEIDKAARMAISQDLGHGRLKVTETYLGA
jgi:integrase